MRKFINFDERVFNQLKDFCSTNNIKINDYLYESILNRLYTDIYGDMNVMKGFIKKEDSISVENQEKNINLEEIIDEIIINKQKQQVFIIDKEDKKYNFDINRVKIIEKQQLQIIEDNEETAAEAVVKIKRQLKTK